MTIDTLEARFWRRVHKSDGCWSWRGSTAVSGYGRLKFRGKYHSAHRLSFLINCGPIGAGLHVCHSCDNRRCVRPDHLWLGTPGDNQRDCTSKGRRAYGLRNGRHTMPGRTARGERQAMAKLRNEDIATIRSLGATLSQQQIATMFGVTQVTISAILRRKTWAHLP